MSDKLIEIAKANGAYPFDKNGNFAPVDVLVITPDQLRATVEQVCAPLVEAMERISCNTCNCDSWEYCRNTEPNDTANDALTTYRALIGDKHE